MAKKNYVVEYEEFNSDKDINELQMMYHNITSQLDKNDEMEPEDAFDSSSDSEEDPWMDAENDEMEYSADNSNDTDDEDPFAGTEDEEIAQEADYFSADSEDADEVWGESYEQDSDFEFVFEDENGEDVIITEGTAPKKLTGKAKSMRDDKVQLMNALNKDTKYIDLVDTFEKKALSIVKSYISDLKLKIKPAQVFQNLKLKGEM